MVRLVPRYGTSLAFAVALVVVAAMPGVARAEDNLARALERYDELRFEEALSAAEAAILDPARGHAELVFAYEIIGLSAAALEEEEKAFVAFRTLLAIAPDHELPSGLAPRFTSPFMEAKGYWAERKAFGVTIDRFDSAKLRLEMYDPLSLIKKVRVRFRPPGAPKFSSSATEPAPRMTVPLPGVGGEVDVVIQVLDGSDGILQEIGSRDEPLRLKKGSSGGLVSGDDDDDDPRGPRRVRKKIKPALLRAILIGVAVGAVVVAGGVVGGILIHQSSPFRLGTGVAFGDP